MGSVVASYRPLQEVVRGSSDSPFFNVFSTVTLGLMEDDDARGFLAGAFASAGVKATPGAVAEALELAGPHPCFLSELGFALLGGTSGTTLEAAAVRGMKPAFCAAVSGDLHYYWQHLSDDQRALLRDMAGGTAEVNTSGANYRSLRDLSLVRDRNGRPTLFCRAFRDHVEETKNTEPYFRATFGDPLMSSPPFHRLLETMLASATHVPVHMRAGLSTAIRDLAERPHTAVFECVRQVVEGDLLRLLYRACDIPWRPYTYNRDVPLADLISVLFPETRAGKLPKAYDAHLHRLRHAGNIAGHRDAAKQVTPALAFLAVAETIYLAEDAFARWPRLVDTDGAP